MVQKLNNHTKEFKYFSHDVKITFSLPKVIGHSDIT